MNLNENLKIGDMQATGIDFDGTGKIPVFLIKDKEIPPMNPYIETKFMCFLGHYKKVIVPIFYFMVQFNQLEKFRYGISLYPAEDKEFNKIHTHLTYKDQIAFSVVTDEMANNNVFNRITLEIDSEFKSKIKELLKIFAERYNEYPNKGSKNDFIESIPLFFKFIGSRIESWDVMHKLYLDYGQIINVDLK